MMKKDPLKSPETGKAKPGSNTEKGSNGKLVTNRLTRRQGLFCNPWALRLLLWKNPNPKTGVRK
jgi:hypothetical protein